jgi:DNA-binding SARP family transcriptional activator/tetratricopeptide (TPR) repeat protein
LKSLRILGPVEVWRDDERLALGGPRQLTLLAFLVLHANRAISRDALSGSVWGSVRSESDSRLQMAIVRLRKALEPLNDDAGPRLRTVSGGYLLSILPGELDADIFHSGVLAGARALEAGEPAQAADLLYEALALWRGPPLAEVAFEDFALGEIRRLEELRLRALECRIDAELQLGRHAELIGELEDLLTETPTAEHLAGQLMLALYRCGRQADALGVYHRVRTALAEHVGLEPGPQLRALQTDILEHADSLEIRRSDAAAPHRQVSTGRTRAPLPSHLTVHGPSVFADRHRERDVLHRAWVDLPTSGRQAAFVTGEPGIGKTRLVSEFAEHAHANGALVLAGRCDDDLSVPYEPFVEALDHLIEHASPELLERHISQYGDSIARLVPALASHAVELQTLQAEPSESERYVLFRAIEGLLAAACEQGPVLLVLEDLHWAELPTLKLLRRLLTVPRSWSLMVVATCRIDGLSQVHALRDLLARLHRESCVYRLDLTGLDIADVVELVKGIGEAPGGTADEHLARALEMSTSGNPFFITQLVRSLTETGSLVSRDGRMVLSDGVDVTAHLPVSISETLEWRLRRLPDDTRRCLGVAAVVGEQFNIELVSEIAGAESTLAAVEFAVAGGVLIEVPGRAAGLRFAHALVQRYLYQTLGATRRRQLHRQIAVAMEVSPNESGGQLAELARHWVEAADPDIDSALRYSVLAGDDALGKLAPDQARRWYEEALELLETKRGVHESERCELLIKRGEAERQAGDRRFRETLLDAAGIAQRIEDGSKLVRAALGNTRGMQSETGVVDEGRIATLDCALRIIGDQDSPEHAQLLAMYAAELMYSQEWDRRVRLSDEALAMARRLDDQESLVTVLNMRFVTLLAPETLAERQANTQEAVGAAGRLRDPLLQFYAYHWRAYACIEAGDILAARSWAVREREIADRFRQPTTLWLGLADEANLAVIAGDLEPADELSKAALELGQNSEPDALACFAAQQTSIAFERGGLAALAPLLEQAVRDNPGVPGFRATLALALTEGSQHDEARTLLDQAVAVNFHDIPYDVTWLAVICIYAHVSTRLGEVVAARALYRMLEPWSEQIAFPAFGVWGPVSLYLGSLAVALGETSAAERHLREAARIAIRAGAPLWEVRAASRLRELAEPR